MPRCCCSLNAPGTIVPVCVHCVCSVSVYELTSEEAGAGKWQGIAPMTPPDASPIFEPGLDAAAPPSLPPQQLTHSTRLFS